MPTTLNPALPARSDSVVFLTKGDGTTIQAGYYARVARNLGGFIGDAATAIVQGLRRKTQLPIFIVQNAESGTSPIDLMDDSQSGRTWEDFVGKAAVMQNRGPNGEYVITGDVWGGWEASLSGNPDPVVAAFRPWFTGIASGLTTTGSTIAQTQLNHWRFDGTFSSTSKIVVVPNGRLTPTAASATATDFTTEADQRDQYRNWAHILGYEIAPEHMTYMVEGEVAAGGLPAGAQAGHPEDGVYEGASELATHISQAMLQALGLGDFPGPLFCETLRAGSANNKVIVGVGNPRRFPGEGLSTGATGYSVAYARAVTPSAVKLRTKKVGGDPGAAFEARKNGGAWSKANVTTGAIISGREVELTLAFTYATGDTVEVRYMPGGGGGYSAATITQEAWRSGALFFGPGASFPAGTITGGLEKLGWAVSGSNQALSMVAA